MLARRWYAQSREDRRLHQALSHIENGRYVDIGAYEPEFNSVTKVFYDEGWSGVNVEPNPRAFAMLQESRLRDHNIQAVVTWKLGPQTLYLTDERGWSSLREDVAFAAAEAGMTPDPIEVDAISLADVFDVMPEGDTHFLKIDVEGAEEDVIASGDWKAHRPWVVLAEANFPQSRRTVYHHHLWEPYLLSRGYVFKGDDTLNRWYVAKEQLDNIGSFVLE